MTAAEAVRARALKAKPISKSSGGPRVTNSSAMATAAALAAR